MKIYFPTFVNKSKTPLKKTTDQPTADIAAVAAEIEAIKTRLAVLEELLDNMDSWSEEQTYRYGGTD